LRSGPLTGLPVKMLTPLYLYLIASAVQSAFAIPHAVNNGIADLDASLAGRDVEASASFLNKFAGLFAARDAEEQAAPALAARAPARKPRTTRVRTTTTTGACIAQTVTVSGAKVTLTVSASASTITQKASTITVCHHLPSQCSCIGLH